LLAQDQELEALEREVVVEGITLPVAVEVGDHLLELNGTGIRRAFFRNFYVGALYLPEPMSSTAEIISRHGASRISLNFIRDVSLSRMQGALDDGFEDNTPAEARAELADEIEQFKSFFTPPKEGDRINIDYDPDRGTIVTVNGEEQGVVEGAEFNLAVLRIFLGENPADSNLRDGMLGLD
ncbi:chalcone isomerase family protein, partial [Natronospira sp.]